MTEKTSDVNRIIDDLMYVKNAIRKNNSILKYISLSQVLRKLILAAGLLITILSGTLYLLLEHYGSFAEIPRRGRVFLYIILAGMVVVFAVAKVRGIMASVRKVRSDFTIIRLVKEVYTPQALIVMLPSFAAMAGVVIFLATRGASLYIVPSLAILLGLMFNSLNNIFYLREISVVGDWMILTGLVTLYAGERLHSLLGIILTFGLGFIVMFVASVILAERESSRG